MPIRPIILVRGVADQKELIRYAFDDQAVVTAVTRTNKQRQSPLGTIMKVRPATLDDIPQITEILNHYILNSVIIFRIEKVSQSDIRETFNSIKTQNLPFIVVADSNERVLGYTYASGYRIPYSGIIYFKCLL